MNVIPFVDHKIGFKCLELLLASELEKKISVPYIVTTQNNNQGWWPDISKLAQFYNKEVYFIELLNRKLVEACEVDLFLLLSWKYVLNEDLLQIPNVGTINLHYSLLPDFRGVYPVNWAIMNGDNETGITFHWVTKTIDSGNAILKESVLIDEADTAWSLLEKLDQLAFKNFSVLLYVLPTIIMKPGVESSSAGTYFSRKDFEKAREIDMNETGLFRDFYNKLRGLSFQENHPLAYFVSNGKKIYLFLKTKTNE